MVASGPAVPPIRAADRPAPAPPAAGPAAVHALTLTELAERVPAGVLRRPHRLGHHLLLLVTAGHGSHTVDFVRYRCRPGTLVWARPGQVVRYGLEPGFDAALVRWTPDFLPPLPAAGPVLDEAFGPVCCQLSGEDEDAVISEVSQLAVDCARAGAGTIGAELLRHQLAVLVLRVATLLRGQDQPRAARTPDTSGQHPDQAGGYALGPAAGQPADRWTVVDATTDAATDAAVFPRFRREVERSFADTRRVEDYAARLGCSVRTLTRASLAATGRGAKQLIDGRVALEAQRLLADTDQPVAEIGRALGFPEPTNFGRFFIREVGLSPGTFRAHCRR